MNRRQALGLLGVLLALGIPIVSAALTASFSDTVWQVPTIKSDAYYLGAAINLTPALTALGAEPDISTYPQQPATYTIWVDAGTYYAKNGDTGAVTSNANIATLTQSIFTAMSGGGTLTYAQGTYAFSDTVTYEPQYKMKIIGYGAIFKPSANDVTLLRVHQGVLMTNGGCLVEGISFKNPDSKTGCTALEVFDSYGATLKNLYIQDYYTGIFLNNYDFWTESTTINDVTLYDNTNGIRFGVDGGTNSFGQINLKNIYMHVPAGVLGSPGYGIFQPNGVSIYRGLVENVVFWLGGDYSTGWYCNGDFTDARINMSFEATAGTPTEIYGVYIDALATYGRSTLGNSSYAFTHNAWGNKFTEQLHGYNSNYDTVSLDSSATYVDGSTIDTYIAGITPVIGNYTLTAPSGDDAGSGTSWTMTVGENVVAGEVLYMKNDGKLWKADADSNTTAPAVAIAAASISAGAAGKVYLSGLWRDDSYTWTPGAIIYLSTSTGDIDDAPPAGSGDQVQVIGYAVSATVIYFSPNFMLIELT